MSATAVAIHEQPHVPQPRQVGKPGGFLRHTNFLTATVSGIVLAAIFYVAVGAIVQKVTGGGQQDNLSLPDGLEVQITFMYIGWVVGFMIGIGAFAGPIRWMLGHDLTHADAEYMAGKDAGRSKYWKYTTDHKVVGIQYLVVTLVLFGVGGLLAMLIRTELGVTWAELFNPNFYNSLIGTHGIVMIIAMIITISGPLGNFIVPIMCGARDMAFPRLNALSIWLLVAAIPPLVSNLLMGGIRDGWTVYEPLSDQAPVGMIGYQITIITFAFSTGIASVNLITTIVSMRARGMTWSRVPIFVYGVMASAIMGLIWFPMYQYSQILALSDRVLQTSFFTPASGGSVWLYENLFWLLGHPEVYVIVLPATAALLEIMPVFLRKPLFSYRMALAGIFGIVGLSAIVWVHHMYMTGWAPASNYPFMLSTEMISLPFSFLLLVMLGTMWRGKPWMKLPMMAVYAVVWDKVIGGITGVFLSDTPVDQYMHGSMFVVAHFHFMLMGAGDGRHRLLVPQDDLALPRRAHRGPRFLDRVCRLPDHVHVDVRRRAAGHASPRAAVRQPVQRVQLDLDHRCLHHRRRHARLPVRADHLVAQRRPGTREPLGRPHARGADRDTRAAREFPSSSRGHLRPV